MTRASACGSSWLSVESRRVVLATIATPSRADAPRRRPVAAVRHTTAAEAPATHWAGTRKTTEGILAIVKTKELALNKLRFKNKNPLILIAEAPEKPGNIGALLRSADAANLDGFIIANPKTDLYNPNIIRSSVGCLFTNNIATGSTQEIIDFLAQQNIQLFSAILQESKPYHSQDFTKPTAIAVGTEATGLSEIWRTQSTQNIHIPMQGAIDSMNVSVAAGILIFEAKRQRGF